MRRFLGVLVFTLFLTAPLGAAQALRFASGPEPTVMIELFTSEGCNSCPPAEAWLNRFTDHPALWQKFIPLAFHVDYWDYLGWQDRYAQAAYSRRQRHYAERRHVRTVYTPALVANGREWRRTWSNGEPDGGGAAAGVLTVNLQGKQYEATFAPAKPAPASLQLHLAILGMGLTTEIRAGENAGRHARHEFVVLAHQQIHADSHRWRGTLPALEADWGATRLALVAWVSRADDPTPLQATGGYLPARGR
jgi:hypothetical protein